MNRQFLRLRVSWEEEAVDRDLDNALADSIVPELKALIDKHAKRIASKYESPERKPSPLAVEAAADLLLYELINFMTLDEVDAEDAFLNVQRHQMNPAMVRWFLGYDEE